MRTLWTRPALADVRACVPAPFRPVLRERLATLRYVGQGRSCASPRYPGTCYLKIEHWLVMFRPIDDEAIAVVAVEYNYGQEV